MKQRVRESDRKWQRVRKSEAVGETERETE